MLIKGLIKRRFWWTFADRVDEGVHFLWTQLKNNDYIKNQKPFSKMNNYSKMSCSSVTLNTVETNSDTECPQKKAKSPEHSQES